MKQSIRSALFAIAALGLLAPGPAQADAVADFYKGKTITVFFGYGPGGAYDAYGRTVDPNRRAGQAMDEDKLRISSPSVSDRHLLRIAPCRAIGKAT